MTATLLVTGGAGFIGGCFVRQHIAEGRYRIVNLDLLTYAGNLDSIPADDGDRHIFVHGNILDRPLVDRLLAEYRPVGIVHFAAESHVDRSIDGPAAFVQTNVVGTCNLLDAALAHYRSLSDADKAAFRFLHVSTDEVYGSLGPTGKFTETTPYAPNSPYSASKASSDMFVRAYRETYGLPTLITNCSNNYGPYQFPEKLIPLMILNTVEQKPLPVYGDGLNVRDWLFVEDHCRAISMVLENGRLGNTYNIGGDSERSNIHIVHSICDLVDEFLGREAGTSRKLIRFVQDRPGHDRRYAIDATKIQSELGWKPSVYLEEGLRKTVQWYLNERSWVDRVSSGDYRRERLGTSA
ncbi:MAG: dTDP-glucose 4,6-dehydratase [Pirellula sp.]|jgi:dTDP-glucose 4,6-dehydratase|nr:dTDP-glucose 4,6-dehydratase [Pirellula sp.]